MNPGREKETVKGRKTGQWGPHASESASALSVRHAYSNRVSARSFAPLSRRPLVRSLADYTCDDNNNYYLGMGRSRDSSVDDIKTFVCLVAWTIGASLSLSDRRSYGTETKRFRVCSIKGNRCATKRLNIDISAQKCYSCLKARGRGVCIRINPIFCSTSASAYLFLRLLHLVQRNFRIYSRKLVFPAARLKQKSLV